MRDTGEASLMYVPGPMPTPFVSPFPCSEEPALEAGLNGTGGGPMTCDTRREDVAEEEFGGAADAEVVAGGRGDGGTEFRSGAMVDKRLFWLVAHDRPIGNGE